MTRKEAIKELEILKEEYWDDDGYGHETKQYDDTMLALDMAIKALEQESILDKIRAEKNILQENIKALGEDMRICQKSIIDEKELIGFNMAVALCNKHLAESEDKK